MSTLALVSTRHEYERVFAIYVPIAVGVFVLVLVVVLGAVLRYRRRAPERAAKWHENNPLEASYAVFLAAVVAFLLYITFSAEHQTDTVSKTERPVLTINVTAAKWEWQFSYPQYGIVHRSGTVGRQPLVVPLNQPVRFNLTSQDVIHAFWIPEIYYKHDVFPGTVQAVTLSFTNPGLFLAQCAEFCGARHAEMVFNVRVVPYRQFLTWARSRGRTAFL